MEIEFDIMNFEKDDNLLIWNIMSKGLTIGTVVIDDNKIYDLKNAKKIKIII